MNLLFSHASLYICSLSIYLFIICSNFIKFTFSNSIKKKKKGKEKEVTKKYLNKKNKRER